MSGVIHNVNNEDLEDPEHEDHEENPSPEEDSIQVAAEEDSVDVGESVEADADLTSRRTGPDPSDVENNQNNSNGVESAQQPSFQEASNRDVSGAVGGLKVPDVERDSSSDVEDACQISYLTEGGDRLEPVEADRDGALLECETENTESERCLVQSEVTESDRTESSACLSGKVTQYSNSNHKGNAAHCPQDDFGEKVGDYSQAVKGTGSCGSGTSPDKHKTEISNCVQSDAEPSSSHNEKPVPEDEIGSVEVVDINIGNHGDNAGCEPECDQSSSEALDNSASGSQSTHAVIQVENSLRYNRVQSGNVGSKTDQTGAFENSVPKMEESINVQCATSDINENPKSIMEVTEPDGSIDPSRSDTSLCYTQSVQRSPDDKTKTCSGNAEDLSGEATQCQETNQLRGVTDSSNLQPNTNSNGVTENLICDNNTSYVESSLELHACEGTSRTPDLIEGVPDCDSEEELLSELDATLKGAQGTCVSPSVQSNDENFDEKPRSASSSFDSPNGISQASLANIPEFRDLKRQLRQAKQLLFERECEISRLKEDRTDFAGQVDNVTKERDKYLAELNSMKKHNADDLYIPQIKELEYTIAQQNTEIRGLKEKLSSHDTSAKKAISALQQEMKLRIDQVGKQCEEAVREKDSMVVKFAQAEHKNLDLHKTIERAEEKLKGAEKEKESLHNKIKGLKEQRLKIATDLDAKSAELNNTLKDLEKHKEMLSSGEVRIKWAQNKLKAELEAHKETKATLEKTTVKLREAKEETEMIRRDCQGMIKTYQESEEIKSNSLDRELKQKETELMAREQQKSQTEELHHRTMKELEMLKVKHKETAAEVIHLKDRVKTVESEKKQLSDTSRKYEDIIQKQKREIKELQDRIEHLVRFKEDFNRAQDLIKSLDTEISDLKISNKDLVADMEACKKRETDKLELMEKLAAKNANLQSENNTFSNKVIGLTGELQTLKMDFHSTDSKLKDVSEQLASEQRLRQEEVTSLSAKLTEKTKAVEDLSRKVEDGKDDIRTLKRKHTNNVKDLTRQLQQVRRKLESYETTTNGDKDTTSLGSRTSSSGSINTVGVAEGANAQQNTPPQGGSSQGPPPVKHPSPEEYPVITEQVEVDKQLLIERIVRLQRAHARKNEKIEFMDDHISQLVDEIQKKNKIIQTYVLREEAGTLTSEFMDKSKAELSKKHSIMGSVYSSHATDGSMTLDLSLEINRKLQAVVEDTLLKNITLKESLDTLGQEIARLSQENRRLQLLIQGKPKGKTSKGNS